MIRVILPAHLRTLARVAGEVELEVAGPATQRSVLDALEARCPTLRGTIRDYGTLQRRPFVRFFACEEDLSHESPDAPLPEAVASGVEPFLIVGAIAGGCGTDSCTAPTSSAGDILHRVRWPVWPTARPPSKEVCRSPMPTPANARRSSQLPARAACMPVQIRLLQHDER